MGSDGDALLDEQQVQLPLLLYVPTQPVNRGDDEMQLELRHTVDRRLTLLGYSTLDQLVAGCGDAQPSALIPTQRVREMQSDPGYEVIVLDTPLPELERRGYGDGQ